MAARPRGANRAKRSPEASATAGAALASSAGGAPAWVLDLKPRPGQASGLFEAIRLWVDQQRRVHEHVPVVDGQPGFFEHGGQQQHAVGVDADTGAGRGGRVGASRWNSARPSMVARGSEVVVSLIGGHGSDRI